MLTTLKMLATLFLMEKTRNDGEKTVRQGAIPALNASLWATAYMVLVRASHDFNGPLVPAAEENNSLTSRH